MVRLRQATTATMTTVAAVLTIVYHCTAAASLQSTSESRERPVVSCWGRETRSAADVANMLRRTMKARFDDCATARGQSATHREEGARNRTAKY